jgi:hypothetical protein
LQHRSKDVLETGNNCNGRIGLVPRLLLGSQCPCGPTAGIACQWGDVGILLLKDKAVADAYRTHIATGCAEVSAMMEICPVAGADSQVQVDAVFENMANVIRQAASASIGTKISRGRSTAAWWT